MGQANKLTVEIKRTIVRAHCFFFNALEMPCSSFCFVTNKGILNCMKRYFGSVIALICQLVGLVITTRFLEGSKVPGWKEPCILNLT